MKVVIDGDFIAKKKLQFENFEKNWYYIPQKKAKNMWNSNSVRKSMIYCKKIGKKKFSKFFFQRGDPLMSKRSKNFFAIFQIFKNFFWKVASMGHKKCRKKQSHEIWAPSNRPLRRHVRYTSSLGLLDPPAQWGIEAILGPFRGV